MSRAERKQATFGDMARTLAVFALIIGASLAFVPRKHHDKVKPIEYADDLSVFTHASTFVPLVPTPMPEGWQVTSFSGTAKRDGSPSALHMGIVTKATHYVAVEETDAAPPAFAQGLLPKGAAQTDRLMINGQRWDVFTSSKGPLLELDASSTTQIILTSGTDTTLDELKQLAMSLKPQSA